jgi:deoxyribodipyrimidine photo-lyase
LFSVIVILVYQGGITLLASVVQGAFRAVYNGLEWSDDEHHFQAWCAGQTGYPIVDAAMRCLNATGWMHNRLRMIVPCS